MPDWAGILGAALPGQSGAADGMSASREQRSSAEAPSSGSTDGAAPPAGNTESFENWLRLLLCQLLDRLHQASGNLIRKCDFAAVYAASACCSCMKPQITLHRLAEG